MTYEPDHFLIMRRDNVYKLLCGWSGGYLDPDVWRFNSGIVSYTQEESGIYVFYGYSGSVYKVNKKTEGLSFPMVNIHRQLISLGFENLPLEAFEKEFTSPLH